MKKWTISRRVTFGFTAVIATAIALGTFAFSNIRHIQADSATITDRNLPGIELAARAANLATSNRLIVYKHISSTDAADLKMLERQFADQRQEVTDALDRLGQVITTAEGQRLLTAITDARHAYLEKAAQLFEQSRTTKDTMATYRAARAELDPLGLKYGSSLEAMLQYQRSESDRGAKQIRTAVLSASWGIAIGLAIATVLGVAIGFAIVRSIGGILRAVSASIDSASAQVAVASGQMASSSQSLAEGSTEQAASLEETSASLEEMASMTKRNAESAARAKSVSNRMRSAAETGSSDVEEMNRAMAAIKVSSDEISHIVKSIDEIAFQTNILALNAAVEAARAGEAGMGFAVVADEVRNLAQRSAQSAKETAAKIEDSVKRSEHGVRVSQKVAQSLTDIVGSAREADALIGEIAQASKEQEQGITQLNTAVAQMDKVTQANASTAEETASSAQELSAQAASQKDAIRELLALVGSGQGAHGTESAKATPASAPTRASRRTDTANGNHVTLNGGANGVRRFDPNRHANRPTLVSLNGHRHGGPVEALSFQDM